MSLNKIERAAGAELHPDPAARVPGTAALSYESGGVLSTSTIPRSSLAGEAERVAFVTLLGKLARKCASHDAALRANGQGGGDQQCPY